MTTRTRPRTLSASRRKRRPALECLEEKNLLSIVFASFDGIHQPGFSGTYAYDSTQPNSLRQITPAVPTAMSEGADGTLFAAYANGIYRYDYGSNTWTGVDTGPAIALSAARDNSVFASFTNGPLYGTYEIDGSFNGIVHQLTTNVAPKLAAVSHDHVYLSLNDGWNDGTYEYNQGTVSQISLFEPTAMAASPDGTLFASYGGSVTGTWEYNDLNSWTKLYSEPATNLVAISYGDYVGTFSDGTYEWNGAWHLISVLEADNLGAAFNSSGVTLIGSFASTCGATWVYQNGHWTELTMYDATLVA
jgi:hypothetical protein